MNMSTNNYIGEIFTQLDETNLRINKEFIKQKILNNAPPNFNAHDYLKSLIVTKIPKVKKLNSCFKAQKKKFIMSLKQNNFKSI